MTIKAEIYEDIQRSAEALLAVLSRFPENNHTAEGRMIYQCRWLREQVITKTLPLPVEDYIHTLRHVYSEELLRHTASRPELFWNEVQIHIYRLLKLTDGKLIVKPEYYPAALRCIDALCSKLSDPAKYPDTTEQTMIKELSKLRELLGRNVIEPPLESFLPDYPAFNKIDGLVKYAPKKYTASDSEKQLIRTVANLIFEGVRPQSWTTPEVANREIENL